jgi:hypothetical protein
MSCQIRVLFPFWWFQAPERFLPPGVVPQRGGGGGGGGGQLKLTPNAAPAQSLGQVHVPSPPTSKKFFRGQLPRRARSGPMRKHFSIQPHLKQSNARDFHVCLPLYHKFTCIHTSFGIPVALKNASLPCRTQYFDNTRSYLEPNWPLHIWWLWWQTASSQSL